jgi:hypothetical protein
MQGEAWAKDYHSMQGHDIELRVRQGLGARAGAGVQPHIWSSSHCLLLESGWEETMGRPVQCPVCGSRPRLAKNDAA